ncbi:sperm acrosome-associated protein 9 [Silurus asotus]|uniref:Sperm acrosome-associated protein 9 n=1 Tax=Silurus asotus TaxID=30991 RepID=A0AAD5AAC9_SILAS|nr:sperm acrosome-associated protein 9 [Silurus asotus]
MKEVKEMLMLIEEKHQIFKQQQLRFIAALERSRESAHCQTRSVSSISEVQWYMTHCSNSTDQRAFSLFLELMSDLKVLFQMIDSLASAKNFSSGVLDTCRNILSPDCNFSELQAQYPHDVVNRLSCTEAKHYYAGVVSVIPVTLDLLSMAISQMQVRNEPISQTDITEKTAAVHEQNTLTNTSNNPHSSKHSYKAMHKGASGWKPLWRPPWRN